MTVIPNLLFAAVHNGPYLSLKPLEAKLGGAKVHYLAAGPAKQRRVEAGLPFLELDNVVRNSGNLENFIKTNEITAVVRGTSVITDEPCEANPETEATIAAERVGIPVLAIEDFPGNYRPEPQERLDCLCVGEEATVQVHRNRGVDQDVIFNTGNPRYDELKKVDREYLKTSTKTELRLSDELVLLWAGQPDGENSYLALERLLRCFGDRPSTLLFRAHPRDAAYLGGKYQEQLSAAPMRVLDVTGHSDPIGLCCASDLVVTQFSSLAVEASHLGVPALFTLFDDLGKEFLRTLYGFDQLPWSADKCSFLIENESEAQGVLETALFDESAREEVRSNFQSRFASRSDSAQVVADRIMALAVSGIKIGKEVA